MNEHESKIRDYYELQPTRFSALQSLTLSQGFGASGACEQRLCMVLGERLEHRHKRLHLDFDGVRNLSLQQPDWSLLSLGHIEILLGSDLPNVEGNYLVRDPEQERILWFECREFHAYIA